MARTNLRDSIELSLADELIALGHALIAERDLDRLVQTVTDVATRLAGAEFGAFFYNVVNDQGEAYSLYTLSGAPRDAFERFGIPRKTAVFGPTFNGQGTLRSDDITRDPRYGHNSPHHGMPRGHLPVRSYLAVPVVSRSGEVLGGLFFGHPDAGRFTPRIEYLIEALASHAAVAIDNTRLHQRAQRSIDALREADTRKDEFLAMLAHELRNPLAPLRNMLKLMEHEPLTERGRLAQQMGVRQLHQLARLVDDLLEVARITRGTIELRHESVMLQGTIYDVARVLAPVIEERRQHLELRLPPRPLVVQADPVRLAQIVENLLANASKYTDPGGRIDITLSSLGLDAVIEVSDTGVGIAADDLPRLFELFTQINPSIDRSRGGLGLGLALVKRLAELHGGAVSCRSEGLGKGSTFTVRLPCDREAVGTDSQTGCGA